MAAVMDLDADELHKEFRREPRYLTSPPLAGADAAVLRTGKRLSEKNCSPYFDPPTPFH